jgi:ubiquinone/menaquinone biosynthesis C-methylase UbiE
MGDSNKYKKPSSDGEIERIDPQNIPWYKKRLLAEHEMRYRFSLQFIKGKTVLDIACGSGYGSSLLATSAKKVYAIDNDPSAISYAKKFYNNPISKFSLGNAQKIGMKNNSLDVVVSFETIEHLPKPNEFLLEMRRVLRKTGILVLSTPNKDFSHGDNPYHIQEFSFDELSSLLTGFHTIEYYGQRPVNVFLFSLYKNMEKRFPFAKKLFHFRPWERIKIEKINKNSNYLYLIAVCKK